MATFIALVMVAMLTMIGLAALSTSDDEVKISGNDLHETQAFYAAESGLQVASAHLQKEYEETGAPPLVMPEGNDSINSCSVKYGSVDAGPAEVRELTTGSLAGLHGLVKTFNLSSTAINASQRAQVTLNEQFETALVPIFQFAVFYGNDLEIAPGADMTLVGRVHSNGNLWVQANSSLKMDSYVTASGKILHGRKGPEPVSSGDVLIKDATGAYASMKLGSGWLDANNAKWYDSSVARWDGRVKDSAHGQGKLNLPLAPSAGGDPHKLIERESGNPDSYEAKSTLKFIDGKAFRKVGGSWSDVTATFMTLGIMAVADNKFKDQRENKKVDVTELDIKKLQDNGYAPSNGVIYFSDKTAGKDYPALRLKNGSTLGSGLTIASENPIYTVGDYNSVNKQPASLMADAVTFLSSSWNDVYGDSSKSKRIAVATKVNASYLTGNVNTTATTYNGGFENLPRFLETWTGKNFTWSGSAVNLWNSKQAIGTWNGTYYNPPNRIWSYDVDLDDPNKLPPETPAVRVFQRTGWQQQDVGYAAN